MGKKLDIKTPFNSKSAAILTEVIGSDSEPLDLTGSDLLAWIPEQMEKDLYNFNEDYIIALETNDDLTYLKGLFNGESYHGIGGILNFCEMI